MKERFRLLSFFVFLITLSSIFFSAVAYIPCQCNNPPDQCACFIQLGDKGLAVKLIISVLQAQGYVSERSSREEFTPEIRAAVVQFQSDHGLECTGWMDDETLNELLKDKLPDQTEKHSEKYWNAICYVPTDGGNKFHASPSCSDMSHPRVMTIVNARRLGVEPCGKNNCGQSFGKNQTSVPRTRILPDDYYSDEDENDAFFLTSEGKLFDSATVRSLSTDETYDTDIIYIGNKNSHVFHQESCSSVKSMSDKNLVIFLTRDEAIEQGYEPCGRCNP